MIFIFYFIWDKSEGPLLINLIGSFEKYSGKDLGADTITKCSHIHLYYLCLEQLYPCELSGFFSCIGESKLYSNNFWQSAPRIHTVSVNLAWSHSVNPRLSETRVSVNSLTVSICFASYDTARRFIWMESISNTILYFHISICREKKFSL